MGDTISGQTGELGDCSSADDDVDGVLNLTGDIPLVVHMEIVCNSPLCSFNDRGVRRNDVVGVAAIYKGEIVTVDLRLSVRHGLDPWSIRKYTVDGINAKRFCDGTLNRIIKGGSLKCSTCISHH